DIGVHVDRPAWPPRPDAGANVVNGRDVGLKRPHLLGHAQRKIWTIDGDKTVRLRLCDRSCGLPDTPHQARQIAEHRRDTHNGNLGCIEIRTQPELLKTEPADADEFHLTARLPRECAHQIRGQNVSRLFSGYDSHTQWRHLAHRSRPSSYPRRKRPSSSA